MNLRATGIWTGIAAATGASLGASAGGPAGAAAGAALGIGVTAIFNALMLRDDAAPEPPRAEPAEAPPLATPGLSSLPKGLGGVLLERLPIALVLIDENGDVFFANAAAEAVFERDLTGLHAAAALRSPTLMEAISEALMDGRATEVDFKLVRSSERALHAYIRPLPQTASPSLRPAVMLLLEDHSAVRRAEELRRDFVANASHELKTPLASIGGFIETLQTHAKDDPAARERFLGIMADQAERMRRLVEDLLSLNRIELNAHVAPREMVDLGALTHETVAAFEPVAEKAGSRIELAFDPAAGPHVLGDRDELTQVVVNLVDNALKYGGAPGPVRISIAAPRREMPGLVGLSVSDSGPGIERAHIPRLTERFYRVDAARSRAKGGTGLGLAIVKHILNRHRGDISIESEPGKGACFTIWLKPATTMTTRRTESPQTPAGTAA